MPARLPDLSNEELLQRIFANCTRRENGCIEWNGSTNGNGYGVTSVGQKNMYTHRATAMASGLKIDGLYVCHRCDNRICCNPEHLFVGTAQDNTDDAISKGRKVAPPRTNWPARMAVKKHHWQKLEKNDVIKIRKMLADGQTLRSVANQFGVTFQTISKIKNGSRWAHLPLEKSA